MNDRNRNNQPIRRYRRKRSYGSSRTVLVLSMTVVLIVGVAVFIMSLTGTGLFADREVPEIPTGNTTSSDTEESEPPVTGETEETDEVTQPPAITLPEDEVDYKLVSISYEKIHEGDLVLIDDQHIYTFPKSSVTEIYGKNSTSYAPTNSSIMLKAEVIEELNKMMDALREATGFTEVMISSAYRSFDDQKALYERNPNTAAIPGCSDYHSGATFMIQGYNGKDVYSLTNRSEATWLKENAHKFGFTFRFPVGKKEETGYEIPWQMRYVGIPHATYMYEKFLCLEEYLVYLTDNHRYGQKPLTVACADGIVYEVFYVQGASDGIIQVPVPVNRDYTISGDNKNGFIITVAARSANETA